MKKKVLIFITFLIVIFTFLSLGRVKSEKEIALEKEIMIKKEKETIMNFKLNDVNINNYEIVKSTFVKSIDVNFVEVIHKKTKCKLVLMLCDDKNKAFAISFPTYPYNNNGVAHIMEHSVLCGSRKYNVKDPFFELTKTSLATFLNAMTGCNATYFPFSSTNDQDYKNLMDVYLDGVFYPNFYEDKNILKHEGWHYEIDDKNNLSVSGVVLNEMKGSNISSPYSLLGEYINEDCFNGTCFQYNFGGETNEIINLTQEEFENYHKKYYNPSNAYIAMYGLIDMNERLEYLNDEYLSHFDYVEVDLPKYDFDDYDCIDGTHYYQGDEKEKNKSFISYNFLVDDDKTTMSNIMIIMISYVLFNKQGSLVKDKLIEMGFGEDVTLGINKAFPVTRLCVAVENIDAEKKNEFIKAFNNIIDDIIENGIEYKILESALNALYMSTLDKNYTNKSIGLEYIINMSDAYFYGYPIETFLDDKECMEMLLKEDLKNKNNIFIQYLKKIFKDNQKRCVTVMSPSNNFLKEEEEKTKDLLYLRKKDMQNANSDYKIDDCKKEYNDFLKWSKEVDSEENLRTIPKLKPSDIDRDIKAIDIKFDELYNKKLYKSIQNNNDLVALGVNYYLPKKGEIFDDSEKYFLNVALELLGCLNTKKHTYDDLNILSDYYSTGVVFDLMLLEKCPIIHVCAKTTKDKVNKVYEIINEIMYETEFNDKDRIKQKLNEIALYSSHSVKNPNSETANYRSASKYSYAYELYDKMSFDGYAYNLFINDLLKNYDNKYEEINKGFRYVLNKYLDYNNMFLDCCMNAEAYDTYAKETKDFLKDSVLLNQEKEIVDVELKKILNFDEYNRKFTMEVLVCEKDDVNLVSRAYKYDENKFNGSLFVFNNIINYDYINQKGRIEGGAYTATMTVGRRGYLIFSTKRDPNFVKTDDFFKNTFTYLNSLNITQENLENSIIGTIKLYDHSSLFYNKHILDLKYVLIGDDNDSINEIRHQILDTKVEDLEYFKEVINEFNNESEFCAVVAPSFENEAKEKYKIVKRLK